MIPQKNKLALLSRLDENRGFHSLLDLFIGWTSTHHLEQWNSNADQDQITRFYDGLANRIQEMALNTQTWLDKTIYVRLLPYGTLIGHIFYLSDQKNTNEILFQIRARSLKSDSSGIQFTNPSDAYKYFLLLHPYSSQGVDDLIAMAKVSPQATYPAFMNCLTTRITTDLEALNNRQRLIDHLHLLKNVRPSRATLVNIHLLWAISSYENSANNYKIKIFLNEILENRIKEEKQPLAPKVKYLSFADLISAGKPRLLIIAEVLKHEHVMYRCFGQPLRNLREQFHITILTAEEDLGSHAWDWCDKLITFKRNQFALNIETDRIMKLNPDVILYPSLGMRLWALLMSRMRLAPLQICMMGHPDSPHAREIDYCLIGGALVDPETKFPGNLVTMKSPGSLFDFSFDPPLPKPSGRLKVDVVRIAICANIFKLTLPFLQSCRKIADLAQTKIEFHFMQNLTGVHYLVGRKQIIEGLPGSNVDVYPAMSKSRYFEVLGQCDLYLSPFPFGGENSTMDALLMGLPVVTLKGKEPLTRLDSRVLRELELPDWLSTVTKEDYIKSAMKLIEMKEIRESVRNQLRTLDLHRQFTKETEYYQTELVEIIGELYDEKYDHPSTSSG